MSHDAQPREREHDPLAYRCECKPCCLRRMGGALARISIEQEARAASPTPTASTADRRPERRGRVETVQGIEDPHKRLAAAGALRADLSDQLDRLEAVIKETKSQVEAVDRASVRWGR